MGAGPKRTWAFSCLTRTARKEDEKEGGKERKEDGKGGAGGGLSEADTGVELLDRLNQAGRGLG